MRRAIERTSGVQQPQPSCGIGAAPSSAGVHENIEDLGRIEPRGERPVYPGGAMRAMNGGMIASGGVFTIL
jgi:hypothetical protein